MACSRSIQIYTIALHTVSTLASLAYLEHMFLIIIHLLISSLQNMKKLWRKNFRKEDILVLSQEKNWKPSLDPSSPPPSPLFPNQENQGNIAWSTTSPTHVNLPQIQFHLSILPSAHTIFPAHGELFPPSASSSIDCRQDHRPPSGTLQKPIGPFQYATISGQVWSYASARMTASQPIPAITSASPQQEESMDSSQMPEKTFSKQMEWVQCRNGSTTTYFSGSANATSTHTTTSAIHGARPSPPMEGEYMKEVAYGTGAIPCLMDAQKSLTKTWQPPCMISPTPQHAPQMTPFTHTQTTTLMTSQKGWAYLGKFPRASPLDLWSLTSVSFGTSTRALWQSQRRKNSSTLVRLRNGRKNPHMHWQRYKGFTVSYSMSPWSVLPGVHTLPAWKPCFQASITVLSCHTPHPAAHLMTLNGGRSSFIPCPSQGTSLDQFPSQISTPSQMPALVSVSASQLATTGMPGVCYQAGKPMGKISAGPRLSDLSSSPSSSYHPAVAALTSRFTETTKEWLKDGGKAVAGTNKQISYSGASTPPLRLKDAPSTPDMSPARTTRPTSHPEASIRIIHIFCPIYPSPQNYTTSSPTSTLNSPLQILASAPRQAPYRNPTASSLKTNVRQSMLSLTIQGRNFSPVPPTTDRERRPWNTQLPASSSGKRTRPAPYRKNLTPLPSPLRPHCPANQRLCLWRPSMPHDQCATQLSDDDLKRIEDVMAHAWELDTHATYATGLLNFMVFCDQKNIPEGDRAPASQLLIMSFVSTLAATYSGSAISNYIYGIRAWHLLHSIPWKINKPELEALLKAAEKLTPPSSRRKKRRPYTIDFMQAIRHHIDLATPLGASVFACRVKTPDTVGVADRLGPSRKTTCQIRKCSALSPTSLHSLSN